MREVHIGNIGVDSGQMMLCDPCYIDDSWQKKTTKNFSDLSAFKGEFNYLGACEATLSNKSVGILDGGVGAVCSTGYGDGSYPVYVTYNSEGRVMQMRIDFGDLYELEDEEEDDDYDDDYDEDDD